MMAVQDHSPQLEWRTDSRANKAASRCLCDCQISKAIQIVGAMNPERGAIVLCEYHKRVLPITPSDTTSGRSLNDSGNEKFWPFRFAVYILLNNPTTQQVTDAMPFRSHRHSERQPHAKHTGMEVAANEVVGQKKWPLSDVQFSTVVWVTTSRWEGERRGELQLRWVWLTTAETWRNNLTRPNEW